MNYNDIIKQRELQAALAALDTSPPEEEWMPKVVALFEGVSRGTFRYLDEKPGSLGYKVEGKEWHWKLRRTRNHRVYGPKLFNALES